MCPFELYFFFICLSVSVCLPVSLSICVSWSWACFPFLFFFFGFFDWPFSFYAFSLFSFLLGLKWFPILMHVLAMVTGFTFCALSKCTSSPSVPVWALLFLYPSVFLLGYCHSTQVYMHTIYKDLCVMSICTGKHIQRESKEPDTKGGVRVSSVRAFQQ